MAPRDDRPGMGRELLTIAIVVALIVFVGVLATSCGAAVESTRQVGQAAEDVGDAVATVLGSVNQILLLFAGYLAGELRRPAANLGKRMLNGRKAAKALKRGDAVVTKDD